MSRVKEAFKSLSAILVLSTVVIMAFSAYIRAGAPGIINYQGRVQVDGSDYTGGGKFKFALVNPDGTTTYWSNDGTSTTGSEPAPPSRWLSLKACMRCLGDSSITNVHEKN